MNIRFKTIDIHNFRSIADVKVDLENRGIVVVKGINEYEDNALSNGSGKSSIFEAIVFAVFDETSSGEKDVENRILKDGFRICLIMDIDGVEYKIIREGKSGKESVYLFKNDEDISPRNRTDTNKLILSILCINKNLFLDSIFLSQGATTNLASLTPTARKERLEILTNTDVSVNDFKEKIKARQVEYEANCVSIQQEISEQTGKELAIINQISDIENRITKINEEIERNKRLGTIEDIEQGIASANSEIKLIEDKITEITAKYDEFTVKLKEAQDVVTKIEDDKNVFVKQDQELILALNEYNSSISAQEANIHFYNMNCDKLNKDIETIRNSDTCPTCGRKYENANEEHIKEVINEKMKELTAEHTRIDSAEVEIGKLHEDMEKTQNSRNELKLKLDEFDKKIADAKIAVNDVQNNQNKLIQVKDGYYKDIQSYRNNISNLQSVKEQILKTDDVSKYNDMLTNLKAEQESVKQVKQVKQDELIEQNNYVGSIKHSLQLITKEFRMYLLQNSINYLNKVLETYSVQLFSNAKDKIILKDDDNKLDIFLGNSTYESLSGGEKTRVNIALLLAQKSLSNVIGNISYNIIILDEILGYCDSKAEDKVINLITNELQALETIFMVSHKEVPVGYDSELVVVKDKQGISRVRGM